MALVLGTALGGAEWAGGAFTESVTGAKVLVNGTALDGAEWGGGAFTDSTGARSESLDCRSACGKRGP